MTPQPPLHLFAAYGVELEYMIVDRETLSVAPLADRLLERASGESATSDYEDGSIAWCNELVNHVIELKTNGPAESLANLEQQFQQSLAKVHEHLATMNARLMPTGMHPWMNPHEETKLWLHEQGKVYAQFNKIFDCRGHGWSNLQSTHINLPFVGDEEFGKLHAAIRLVLPLLPALAASSPVMDGEVTRWLDNRLAVYQTNCAKIPSITGKVIPERVYSQGDYDQYIYYPMFTDIAPHDPDELLREPWLNSRGAIARFDRGSIEIRLLDVQECPAADLAIVRLVVEVLKALVSERWSSLDEQQLWPVDPLYELLQMTMEHGEQTTITNRRYLQMFGYEAEESSAGQLWTYLAEAVGVGSDPVLNRILEEGPLARRILKRLGEEPAKEKLKETYRELCDCLEKGEMFHP